MTISFNATKDETRQITEIVKRARIIAEDLGDDTFDNLTMLMDLTACHANGCPLKLEELADAKRVDFVHDVFGIRQHIDRETGQLLDCFVPRYAKGN